MERALDEGVRALAGTPAPSSGAKQSFWIVAAQCGLSGTDVGLRQSVPEAPNATRAAESRDRSRPPIQTLTRP